MDDPKGIFLSRDGVRQECIVLKILKLRMAIGQVRVFVSQPNPFASGETVVTTREDVNMTEEQKNVMMLPSGTTIGDLVRALNAIGVTPRDLISIFQSIKAMGSLQAEIEVI